MIHGLELFVPCIEDEANHASRTEREAPNHWTVNFGREQSSRRATGLSQRSMNSGVQQRRISTSRPKTPLFGIAIPANFHQLSGFDSDLGRVVITHSTYVEGLIPWLKLLACEEGIQTITPAVINRVKGRSPSLQLRVSTTIRGGYKLVARKGSSVQEVFIVTGMEQSQLQKALERHRP